MLRRSSDAPGGDLMRIHLSVRHIECAMRWVTTSMRHDLPLVTAAGGGVFSAHRVARP